VWHAGVEARFSVPARSHTSVSAAPAAVPPTEHTHTLLNSRTLLRKRQVLMESILARVHLRGLRDRFWSIVPLTPAYDCSPLLFNHSEPRSAPHETCHICVLTVDTPPQARPISPPDKLSGQTHYSCYVDFDRRMYQILWTNTIQYPNLSRFPVVDGTVLPVTLSDTMAKVLAASVLLNYGTDGSIRCSHLEPLPIVNIAHPNTTSRRRIQHEFAMLKEMQRLSLPVPLFGDEPLSDGEGIFGYRMELLAPIDLSDLVAVAEDLRAIVDRVHECGCSHGDLNPSNIMRNASGNLVLIDPSFAGPLGKQIPDYVASPQYEGNVFCTAADDKYMNMFFGCGAEKRTR
jgi:hypothetical protein